MVEHELRVNVVAPFNVIPGKVLVERLHQLSVMNPPPCRAMGPPVIVGSPELPTEFTVMERSCTSAPRS